MVRSCLSTLSISFTGSCHRTGGVSLAYKIAVGSSDGINVNLKFGEVTKFLIYEV